MCDMDLVAPAIERYADAHTTPFEPALSQIEQSTRARTQRAGMMGGHVEVRLLQALAFASGATRILEVGTFTGLTALALAQALPADGQLITIEADPQNAAIAREHLAGDPAGAKVQLLEGDARELLAGLDGPFDLAWVDAWKSDYPQYLELVLPLLGPRGVMAFDNALRSGAVLDEGNDTAAFNAAVQADPRLRNAMLTVGDGVLLAWPASERQAR